MLKTCNPGGRALREDGRETGATVKGRAEPAVRPDPSKGGPGTALVCRLCRARITRRDLAMEVNGGHRHVFFNPYGRVFEIGCFASARNVQPAGPKSGEFTWFPGFDWQAVACTGCNAHLGWRYTGGESGFFGLVLAALIEETTGKPA